MQIIPSEEMAGAFGDPNVMLAEEDPTVMDAVKGVSGVIGDVVTEAGGKAVDAVVGAVKGLPKGLGNFAVQFNRTFLPGYEENIAPWIAENMPGLSEVNTFAEELLAYDGKAQEIGGEWGGELIGEFGLPGGALSAGAKAMGVTSNFLANVLGYGATEVIAVPEDEQGMLSYGIDLLAPNSELKTAILSSLASDEDASVFMQKLQKAPENFLVGGVIGEQFDKAIKSVGTLYKYIKGSPRLDGIKENIKGNISDLGGKAREYKASQADGVKLFAGLDPTEFVADAIIKLDDTIKLSNSGKPSSNLIAEEDLGEVLWARAKEMDLDPSKRVKPSGKDPLFETTPEAYQDIMVEQKETYVPRNTNSDKMPLNNRTVPITSKMEEIANVLAERIKPLKGTNVQFFYHTSPLIKKAVLLGVDEEQAKENLKKFALNYAVTSPRTTTEQNLRNASLVGAKENLDIDLQTIVGPGMEKGINEKGYPMIIGSEGNKVGIHKKLNDEKLSGDLDPDRNPKPITFAENVLGNLEGVTVDTHAIRAVLDVMNELEPGSVPIEWIGGKDAKLTKKYKEMYLKDPSSLDVATMIKDTLGTQKIDGKSVQTEYAVFSDLYKRVAEIAGVKPAEAQSLSWFANGQRTGLASEPKTIVDLIEDRIDVTAQILNRSKEEVFKKFFEGKLPLLSIPAGVTLFDTGSSSEESNVGF